MDNKQIFDQVLSHVPKNLSWMKDHILFLTVHGSIAYGLNTPESDIDLRGICTTPKEYLYGFRDKFEQWILHLPIDSTIFEIKKFFSLTSNNNPNTIEIIFTNPEDHLYISPAGQLILDNRNMFLSKQVKERYIGYAKAQAKRIRSHRNYILNPMKSPPSREEMGLPTQPQIEKNQFDAVKAMIQKKIESWIPDFEPFTESQKIYLQNKVSDILAEMEIKSEDKWLAAARSIGLDDNLILVIKQEKEYENKLEDYRSYCEWKKNRNPKRAALEEKYRFDLKHATNLVRLLKMGKEILDTGIVQVKRIHDREELMAIKNGAWTYEQLISYADEIEAEVQESYKNSKLPNQPDAKSLNALCMKIVEMHLK